MVRFYSQGLTCAQIAPLVDRNKGTVYQVLVKAGVAMRKPGPGHVGQNRPDELKAAAVERVRSGKSPESVGAHFGCDAKQVRIWCKAAGLELPATGRGKITPRTRALKRLIAENQERFAELLAEETP